MSSPTRFCFIYLNVDWLIDCTTLAWSSYHIISMSIVPTTTLNHVVQANINPNDESLNFHSATSHQYRVVGPFCRVPLKQVQNNHHLLSSLHGNACSTCYNHKPQSEPQHSIDYAYSFVIDNALHWALKILSYQSSSHSIHQHLYHSTFFF